MLNSPTIVTSKDLALERIEQNLTGFKLADEVRRERNGVFGVEIFLGHDGHNQCTLKDYDDKILAVGESGQNLKEAVERAQLDLRRNRFLEINSTRLLNAVSSSMKKWANTTPVGPDGRDMSMNVFTTAGIQQDFKFDDGWMPNIEDVETLLGRQAKIVRLKGGAHWMLLPGDCERYVDEECPVE